jgi:hypothetical protein
LAIFSLPFIYYHSENWRNLIASEGNNSSIFSYFNSSQLWGLAETLPFGNTVPIDDDCKTLAV